MINVDYFSFSRMMKIMTSTIGDRLREARLKRGFGTQELSLKIGKSRGLVTLIENGYTRDPGCRTMSLLAKELGVSLEWLVNGLWIGLIMLKSI